MSRSVKIFILSAIVCLTLVFSILENRKISELTSVENQLILKELPEFEYEFLDAKDKKKFGEIANKNWIADAGFRGIFVHFWGTWCGPCEKELPEFVELSQKLEKEKIAFLIVAVNDKKKDIAKYRKRKLKESPENAFWLLDAKGVFLDSFGTVKVPETYLFNGSGKNLRKYIGPQDWTLSDFVTSTLRLLEGYEFTVKKQIESH